MPNVALNCDKYATVHILIQTYILYGLYTGVLKSLIRQSVSFLVKYQAEKVQVSHCFKFYKNVLKALQVINIYFNYNRRFDEEELKNIVLSHSQKGKS